MFKYNEATHSIEELPKMKEPRLENFTTVDAWSKENYLYEKHIASLKTYPVAGEVNWKDGDILGEKDFTLKERFVKNENYHSQSNQNRDNPILGYTELVAIPIEQNKKVEEEKENEDEVSLFNKSNIVLHSGKQSDFKIECNALTDKDLECLAYLVSKKIKFGAVVGVAKGGQKLANALHKYITVSSGTWLIVDDVLTTGNSMEVMRRMVNMPKTIGVVIFSRGKCPDWITPIFQMNNLIECKEKEDQDVNAGSLWADVRDIFIKEPNALQILREQFSISKK